MNRRGRFLRISRKWVAKGIREWQEFKFHQELLSVPVTKFLNKMSDFKYPRFSSVIRMQRYG